MDKIEKIYTEKFKIRSYDIDFKHRLKIATIFSYLQETAHSHTEGTALGYEQLKEQKLFWVLTKLKIEVIKYPKWNEEIEVKTWSKNSNKMFAFREFEIESNGEKIAVATSVWALVNSETRKPHRLSELTYPVPHNEKEAMTEKLTKINIKGEKQQAVMRTSAYSDIDIYQHTNNAKYIEWTMDAFLTREHIDYEIKTLQIHFTEETKFGETLEIVPHVYEENNEKIYQVEGIKQETKNKAYQVEIKMIKNA